MNEINNKVYEFAFYTFKKKKKTIFNKNHINYQKSISEIDGNINSNTYSSIDQPNLILDCSEWDNLESAKKSDVLVQSDNRFNDFFESINEILFLDYSILLNCFRMDKANAESIIELKIYEIEEKLINKYNEFREEFYNVAVQSSYGFQQAFTFCSSEDERINIDLLYWSDLESSIKAHSNLVYDQNSVKYKSCVKELLYWYKLTPYKI